MTKKPITVAEIIRLMRRANDAGIVNYRGQATTIATILRARGATATQAAQAARRLKWTSDTVEDWADVLDG